MIAVNVTELEEEGKKYLDNLTDNKRIELRNEMVKFLKQSQWPNSDYALILEFIDDFFLTNFADNSEDEP